MLLRIPGGSGPWHVYWIQWWCCCLLDKRGFIEVPGVGASLEWAEEWIGDSEMDVVTHFFKGLGYKGGERQQVVGEECGVKGRFIFKMGNWCWNADGEETQEKGRWICKSSVLQTLYLIILVPVPLLAWPTSPLRCSFCSFFNKCVFTRRKTSDSSLCHYRELRPSLISHNSSPIRDGTAPPALAMQSQPLGPQGSPKAPILNQNL